MQAELLLFEFKGLCVRFHHRSCTRLQLADWCVRSRKNSILIYGWLCVYNGLGDERSSKHCCCLVSLDQSPGATGHSVTSGCRWHSER